MTQLAVNKTIISSAGVFGYGQSYKIKIRQLRHKERQLADSSCFMNNLTVYLGRV